jgi:hypothetical protein
MRDKLVSTLREAKRELEKAESEYEIFKQFKARTAISK